MVPTVVANPRSDSDFLSRVEAEASRARSPKDLEALLRRDYPRATVHVRDLSSETQQVWYVYREGRWVAN